MSAGTSTDTTADPTTAEPVSRREAMLAKIASLHDLGSDGRLVPAS